MSSSTSCGEQRSNSASTCAKSSAQATSQPQPSRCRFTAAAMTASSSTRKILYMRTSAPRARRGDDKKGGRAALSPGVSQMTFS